MGESQSLCKNQLVSPSKRVAIVQSNYIPWKGYFDLINSVDEFVLFDDMQYTRRDWRNRNKIKTPQGLKWLSIPVKVKGKYYQKINETKIEKRDWANKHWKTISMNYRDSPHFKKFENEIGELYHLAGSLDYLSEINLLFIVKLCKILGISTTIRRSEEFALVEGKSERLLGICQDANANIYISGPAAMGYLDESCFSKAGIEVSWMNYDGYPQYCQPFGEFEHGVSILDLIFCTGSQGTQFMKSFKAERQQKPAYTDSNHG